MKNTSFNRSIYGELSLTQTASSNNIAIYNRARDLIKIAERSKKIPASFDDMEWGKSGREKGKRIGNALHYEIYDISADGKKVLVCARTVSGDRYGQKTTGKEYFLIRAHGKGAHVTAANKALAAKAAKVAVELGDAIATVTGKRAYTAPANKIRTGYKMVKRDASGNLVSVWDGSPWAIGKTRIEAATEDHEGGFYYYSTIEEVMAAAAANDTFGTGHDHHHLVVVEVEASGRHFKHGGDVATKLCASRIRPVREVASTI